MLNMNKIKINTRYELVPTDSHKSFYGKAIVYIDNYGNEYLRSYNTIVAVRTHDGKVVRTWDGYSATTQRHIKSFCGMNKKEYLDTTLLDCKYNAYELEYMYQYER